MGRSGLQGRLPKKMGHWEIRCSRPGLRTSGAAADALLHLRGRLAGHSQARAQNPSLPAMPSCLCCHFHTDQPDTQQNLTTQELEWTNYKVLLPLNIYKVFYVEKMPKTVRWDKGYSNALLGFSGSSYKATNTANQKAEKVAVKYRKTY